MRIAVGCGLALTFATLVATPIASAQTCDVTDLGQVQIATCSYDLSSLLDWGGFEPSSDGSGGIVRTRYNFQPGYGRGKALLSAVQRDIANAYIALNPTLFTAAVASATASGPGLGSNAALATGLSGVLPSADKNSEYKADLSAHPATPAVSPTSVGGDADGPRDQAPHDPSASDNAGAAGETGADPVNFATGEFVLREADLSFPGFGVRYEHRRVYRSRVNFDGPQGQGWDFSYDRRLRHSGSDACLGEILYSTGDGTTLDFRQSGETDEDLSYVTPVGSHLVLRGFKTPELHWILSSPCAARQLMSV